MSQTPEEKNPLTPETPTAEPAKKTVAYDESLFEGSTVFGKPQEDGKKSRLTPKAKGLLTAAIAVAVAGAVGLTVFLLPKGADDTNSSSTASTSSFTVTAIREDNVAEVQVYNEKEFLRFLPVVTESQDEDGEAEIQWQAEGYEAYDLTGAASLVQSAIALESEKRLNVKDGQPLADDYADRLAELAYGAEPGEGEASVYGFDRPYAALAVRTDEDETVTVLIGDYAPDDSGRYISVSGDRHVYIINESKFGTGRYSFNTAAADLINPQMVTTITENDGTKDYFVDGALNYIDTIVLTGSHLDKKLVIETAPEDLTAIQFVVTSPAFRACNEDNVAKILSVAESGLDADGAYKLGYTDEDLAAYGLDDPYTKVAIHIGTYQATLTFGKPIDGYYPCIVSGRDILYKVNDSADWIAFQDKDIYFDSLFLEYIANISEFTVETEEKSVTFRLVREDPDDSSNFTVKVDGYEDLEIPSDELCYYYSRILSLSEEETASGESPTKTPYLTFRFRYLQAGKKEDTIALYRYSTRRYLFTLNGEGSALVSASRVQDLYDCLDALLDGEKIGRASY